MGQVGWGWKNCEGRGNGKWNSFRTNKKSITQKGARLCHGGLASRVGEIFIILNFKDLDCFLGNDLYWYKICCFKMSCMQIMNERKPRSFTILDFGLQIADSKKKANSARG